MKGSEGFVNIEMLLSHHALCSLGVNESEIIDVVLSSCADIPSLKSAKIAPAIKIFNMKLASDFTYVMEPAVTSETISDYRRYKNLTHLPNTIIYTLIDYKTNRKHNSRY